MFAGPLTQAAIRALDWRGSKNALAGGHAAQQRTRRRGEADA